MALGAARRTFGFTLIEILAVVAILALIATFVAPNLGVLRDRQLRLEAQQLVAHLELARQRTVVTGVPHRILFDLEDAGYRLEWRSGDVSLLPAPLDLGGLDLAGGGTLPLQAPAPPENLFEPIPGMLGRFQWLEDPIFIARLTTPEGEIEHGDTFVEFASDGSASHTEIALEDESGRRVTLAVLPLDDAVRWIDEGA